MTARSKPASHLQPPDLRRHVARTPVLLLYSPVMLLELADFRLFLDGAAGTVILGQDEIIMNGEALSQLREGLAY